MNPDTLYHKQYKVAEVIAVGGFATIYRATQQETGHQVAIKVGRVTADPGYARSLREEARILSQLNHRNIVSLHPLKRSGQANIYCARAIELPDNPYFFVMDYLTGGTLESYLQQVGRVTVPEAAAIGLEIARSLHYVHKKGYAHNDLKLENIVFRAPLEIGKIFEPVLVDFGIATRIRIQIEAGSVYIMAPEQLAQAKLMQPPEMAANLDPVKVDVWGLGVILYRMLGGQLPFQGRSEKTVTNRILTSRPTSLVHLADSISQEINELVLDGCLNKNPQQRVNLMMVGTQLKEIAQEAKVTTLLPAKRSGWFNLG